MVQIKTDAIDSKALSHKLQMDLRTILPNKLVVARSYPAGGYPAGMAHYIPGNLFCVKNNKVGSFWIHIPITNIADKTIVGEPECLAGPYTDEDSKWSVLMTEIPSDVSRDKNDLCNSDFGLLLFSKKQSEVLSYDEDSGEVTMDFENVEIIPIFKLNSKTTDKKLEVINGHIVNTWMPSVKEANEEMILESVLLDIYNYKLKQKKPGHFCGRNSCTKPHRFLEDAVAAWHSSRMFRKLAIPYLKNKRKRRELPGNETNRNHLAYGYFLKPRGADMSAADLARKQTFVYRDFHRARLGKKLIKVRFINGALMREVL